jgi:hypothetical protein
VVSQQLRAAGGEIEDARIRRLSVIGISNSKEASPDLNSFVEALLLLLNFEKIRESL